MSFIAVTELPPHLEPVSHDTLLDSSGDSEPSKPVSPGYQATLNDVLAGPALASLAMTNAVERRNTSARSELIDKLHGALARHSITALRVAVGAVFLGFGLLKFFPGVSPAQDLATRTIDLLTFGLVHGQLGSVAIATLECFIGICLLAHRWMRLAVCLLALELVGILSPLVLLPERLFSGPHHAPTLEGQYVLKDIILVAVAMVIAATTFRGGRLVFDNPGPARAPSTKPPGAIDAAADRLKISATRT